LIKIKYIFFNFLNRKKYFAYSFFYVKSLKRNGNGFLYESSEYPHSLDAIEIDSWTNFSVNKKIIVLHNLSVRAQSSLDSFGASLGQAENSEYRRVSIRFFIRRYSSSRHVPFPLSAKFSRRRLAGKGKPDVSQVERGKARRPSETKVVFPDKRSEKERRVVCMEVISGHSFRPGLHLYKDVTFT